MSSENETFHKDLQVLMKLVAYQIVQGKTLTEGAPILRRLGLSNLQIAEIFDSSAKIVSVRLAESKKKRK